MEELRPDNYLEVLEKYKSGCDKKDCYKCPAFTLKFKSCVFDDLKLWQKWAKKRKEEYEKFIDNIYENEN